MLFSELPLIEDPGDSELLIYSNDVASRFPNPYIEHIDQQLVNLVLSRYSPVPAINDHIGDTDIHAPVDDGVISTSSTWSASKISAEIDGSATWVNLDDIPEGNTNLYFTEERGIQASLNAGLGVPSVEHSQVAAAIVAMWQGWSTQEFTYYIEDPSSSPVTITIDGVTTVDECTVTPGPHNITVSKTAWWLNNSLAHKVLISSGNDKVVTPELTLDVFKDGNTNKLWKPSALEDINLLSELVDHYDTNFNSYHSLPINDNSTSINSTWSSFKIIQFLNQQLASTQPPTETKEFAVFSERANSGNNVSGYNWNTVVNGNGTYTHRIARIFNRDDYRSNITASSDYYFSLPYTGNWFIYWIANTDINPYFTGVTNVSTYIGEYNNFASVRLEYPGVINKSWSNTPYLSLITQFTCNQDYNVAYKDTWLVPKSIPGRYEIYSQIHFEKIT